MNQYNPLYHKQNECRNDHPTLNKIPVGFMGFHVEDYEEVEEVEGVRPV